jgi:hypothetical protein
MSSSQPDAPLLLVMHFSVVRAISLVRIFD